MPDDPLSAVVTPPAAEPPVVDPPTADPVAPPAVDVSAAVNEALAPIQTELQRIQTENAELRGRLDAAPTPTPDPAPAPGDWFDKFTQDPEGAVRSIAAESATGSQEQIAPLLATVVDTAHTTLVAGHHNDIDSQYGQGTWNEVFKPVLDQVFTNAKAQQPSLLANREWIDGEVQKLKGFSIDTLVEKRSAQADAIVKQREDGVNEISRHVINSTNLTGGIRPSPQDSARELTAEEKSYISNRAEHSGRAPTADAIKSNLSSAGEPTDFAAWLANKPDDEQKTIRQQMNGGTA